MKLRALCLALPLLLAACSGPSFDHIDFSDVSIPPDFSAVDTSAITLAMGMAVRVNVTAWNDDDEEMEDVSLLSDDESVVGVSKGPSERDFVITGVSVGAASVRVVVEGHEVKRIPTRIIEQKEPKL